MNSRNDLCICLSLSIGRFDAFMAYRGLMQALTRHQEVTEYKGMFIIATGFLLKSIYNFQSTKTDYSGQFHCLQSTSIFWILYY